MQEPNLANTRRKKNGAQTLALLLIDIYVYTEAGSIFGCERKREKRQQQ